MEANGVAVAMETAPLDVDPAAEAERRILALLEREGHRWVTEQLELAGLFGALRRFVGGGGKRLRPAFCFWGAVGAGADPADPVLLDAAAALELLHAFALIHDDVMDGSDCRRGAPAVHRAFADEHRRAGLDGEDRRYGEGLAILAGDLAFVYADTLLTDAPRPARDLWHQLRIELTMGQWIDVTGAARRDRSPERARWVAGYKSGRYTVERPLQLGAVLAGRPDLLPRYARVGRPLGQAFQLRDDLLGALGDPARTGKPVGDDLRDGKPTLLLALATERATPADRRWLARVGADDLGDDDVAELQAVLVRTGATDAIEREITALVAEAEAALDRCQLTPAATDALARLCRLVAWRHR